jgi:hypothetical protein
MVVHLLQDLGIITEKEAVEFGELQARLDINYFQVPKYYTIAKRIGVKKLFNDYLEGKEIE